MKQQTAVEFLIHKLGISKITHMKLFIEALEMEKQQIIDANSNGWHDGQEVIMNKIKSIDFLTKGGDDNGNQYYNETYGSKESDSEIPNVCSSQTEVSETDNQPKDENKDSFGEISDEEIEKFADEELGTIRSDFDFGVIQGMKWYREQLKKL